MAEHLLPADYAMGAFAAILAILGLFRGFSGAFALLVASCAASALAAWLWPRSAAWIANPYLRAIATAAATLVAFGLVRIIVKKAVNGLLDQPLDAIAGCIAGLALAALAILAVSAVPESRQFSFVARALGYYVW